MEEIDNFFESAGRHVDLQNVSSLVHRLCGKNTAMVFHRLKKLVRDDEVKITQPDQTAFYWVKGFGQLER